MLIEVLRSRSMMVSRRVSDALNAVMQCITSTISGSV